MAPYRAFLLGILVLTWVWAAIEPRYPKDWLLENLLVFVFVPLILAAVRRYKLSTLSCTLMTLFMVMHLVGSHYTYAEVPVGFELQRWFGASRNMYDRVVHFSFGLLLAYPLREIVLQATKLKGVWNYWMPFCVAVAFSGVYEIIEWKVAERVDPEAGLAFLGAQGDIWDSQKDMALALIGAAIALGTTALVNWLRTRAKAARSSQRVAD